MWNFCVEFARGAALCKIAFGGNVPVLCAVQPPLVGEIHIMARAGLKAQVLSSSDACSFFAPVVQLVNHLTDVLCFGLQLDLMMVFEVQDTFPLPELAGSMPSSWSWPSCGPFAGLGLTNLWRV